MCVLPIQCKMCKGVFDLWYDLQQQGINGEEFLQSQQNIGGVRMENFCWRCRTLAAEQAKLQEYQKYQKNFLKNRLLHPEGWSLIGDFSDSEIFWMLKKSTPY